MGAAPAAGTVLLGKLRVEQVLGEGGMGVVCKAHHLHLDQSVAIKFLLPQMVENPAIVQRFLREAQAAVRLRSEHVARVIDVGRLDDGGPYMVMEYLEGADLGQIVKHYGAQSPEIAADLMLQACEGIAEAHAVGIVHRDIKPSNFFITRRTDGTPLLKILDFGISSAPSGADSELTRTQSVIGTPAYMAPEQMRSARSADNRSDVWSMGVVLYQVLAGHRPFESEAYSELCLKVGMDPPTPLDVDIDPEYEALVMRCLEKNPDRRFQSVAELAWALVPFASDPDLARGSAERAARILGVPSSTGVMMAVRVGNDLSAGTKTPPPLTPAPLSKRPSGVMRVGGGAPGSNPGSNPGSYPGSNPGSSPGSDPYLRGAGSKPHLPPLSHGPMAPTPLLPLGGKATPTTASAGAGQVSISRSMPTVTPSRRGWLIGLVALTLIGVGGYFILDQDTGDDDDGIHAVPRPAAQPAAAAPRTAEPVTPEPAATTETATEPTATAEPGATVEPAKVDPTKVDGTKVDGTKVDPGAKTGGATPVVTGTKTGTKTGGKTGGKTGKGGRGGKKGGGTSRPDPGAGSGDIFGSRQ